LLILNFKCYNEAIGINAIKLAQITKKVYEEVKKTIILAPTAVDLPKIKHIFDLVIAQHADAIEPGGYTGHLPLEALKEAGAIGVLINHSEKRIDLTSIEFLVKKSKKLGMISIVCGKDPDECFRLSKFEPDMIAIEPPELIGSGKSVSKYKPESITRTLELVKRTNKKISVICGAGITNEEDVKIAIELGSEGVLVSSSFVKSKDPYATLKSMVSVL
jgi:triosephosphate isomerase